MKKNAKLAALAILVLAAVAALSVGITLAVVNARMPAACTCGGQCRSAGTETAAAGDAPSAQQTEPSEADSISIPGFDFLSLQAGVQEQSMPLYNPENNACYFRISLLLDGEALCCRAYHCFGKDNRPLSIGLARHLFANRSINLFSACAEYFRVEVYE